MVDFVGGGFGAGSQLNVFGSGGQIEESGDMASLSDGGFIALAVIDGSLYSQRFDSAGAKVGDQQFIVANATWPSVAGLAGGGYVLTWSQYDESLTGVRAQIFNAAGTAVGDPFRVEVETTGSQSQPDVAGLAGGGFVVTWTDSGGGVSRVSSRLFDSAGEPVSGEISVASTPGLNNYDPQAVALPDGGYLIGWTGPFGTDWTAANVQKFDGSGATVGGILSSNAVTSEPGLHEAYDVEMTVLASGSFVVTWTDYKGGLTSAMGQLYDPSGSATGSQFRMHSDPGVATGGASVTALDDGGFIVAYYVETGETNYYQRGDIWAQRFYANGMKGNAEFLVNTDTELGQNGATIVGFGTNDFAVGWQTYASALNSDFALRKFFSAVSGTPNTDLMSGTDGVDFFQGAGGNDFLDGADGDDTLEGGLGDDTLSGGSGFDVASYSSSAIPVAVSLAISGPQVTGEGSDTLAGIEGLVGSAFGDVLTGNDGDNLIEGGAGNDLIFAGAGADEIYGGAGNDSLSGGAGEDLIDGGSGMDTVSYRDSPTGVTVNLHLASLQQPSAAPDRLISIENVYGSNFDDVLWGASGPSTISGGGGNDMIYLHTSGAELVFGDSGNDIMFFGWSFDQQDYVHGGEGADTVVLQGGAYVSGLTFGNGTTANLVGVEYLSVQSGSVTRWGQTGTNSYDYNLIMLDGNIAAGEQMRINGQSLLAGEDLTFNGSAETDGKFLVYGGLGVDTLTGGAGNDIFFFEAGRFGTTDKVTGGAGADALVISGGTAAAPGTLTLTIGAGQMSGIESLSFNGRFASDPAAAPSYNVTLQSGNIASGETLVVNGSSLGVAQSLSFNGSAETAGKLTLYGGAGSDTLKGGANADLFYAGGGADQLTGGGGADTFQFRGTSDSTSAAADRIFDFASGSDKIDLQHIDAIEATAANDAFTYIGFGAFTGTAGQLRVTGNGISGWTVQGDSNGDGVADFQLLVTGFNVAAGDFIL